jgi:hypothetical protein
VKITVPGTEPVRLTLMPAGWFGTMSAPRCEQVALVASA